jgi:hypothetical protein
MKILGHNWKIKTLPDYERHAHSGDSDTGTKIMRIQITGVTSSEQETIVLHEAIELICHSCELRFRHQNIATLEAFLYAFLKDNGVNLSPLTKEIRHEMQILQSRNTASRKKNEGCAQK